MILLDTSVAIYLRDQHLAIQERVAALSDNKAISLVTLVELEGGVVREPRYAAARRELLDALVRSVDILPFDQAIVSVYAEILGRTGFSRPRILDRLIAATAIVHDLTLVTINGPDFRDIPALKLEVWPAATQ